MAFNDYDREIALVAERRDPKAAAPEIVAVTRLSKLPGGSEAEFALLVSDQYQNRGLGTELLRRLLEVARDEKLTRVSAEVLAENSEMQHLCEKLGFQIHRQAGEPTVVADIRL